MNRIELEKRTKQVALRIIKFAVTLPRGKSAGVVEYQLVKAGTSIGANYREAGRAESRNDFIIKSGSLKKKPPNANIGWRYAMRRITVKLRNVPGCYRNVENS